MAFLYIDGHSQRLDLFAKPRFSEEIDAGVLAVSDNLTVGE